MRTIKVEASKIKKFDQIKLLSGKIKTVDYLILKKGVDYLCIKYMDKTRTFATLGEEVEVIRDKFYSVTHKRFTNNIFELL